MSWLGTLIGKTIEQVRTAQQKRQGYGTLADHGQQVTITQRLRIGRDVYVLSPAPGWLGTLPAEVNFINTSKLPTDLDTPESRQALAELNKR